jgi:hypothetical protein
MECRAEGTHLVIGCDANAHHTSWGSTNINNRGESLFNFIMANGLDITIKVTDISLLHLIGRKLLISQFPLFTQATLLKICM